MTDDEIIEARHNEYLKRRDELLKIRESSQDSFDKSILYLATGGLVLSITFMAQIGKPFDSTTYLLVGFVWLFLVITIFLNVVSYLSAKWNMDNKIKQIDDNYKIWLNTDHKGLIEPEKDTIYKNITEKCNMLSLAFFVTAVILFVWFVMLVQINNYNNGCHAKKEVRQVMTEKKVDVKVEKTITKINALTEAAPAVGKLREGKTEVPRAIAKVISNNPVHKGQTEPSAPIAKPIPTDNNGDKKE